MTMTTRNGRYQTFIQLGQSGRHHDVDTLMGALTSHNDFTTSRLVDFALGLVETHEGQARIRHYLFNGETIQRNYAALYFKRRGITGLLATAVAEGKIDHHQAYSK